MNFTKLFNSILDSTIWQEAKETKLVWITMLAMCDRNGDVFASIPGLAVRAGVTIAEAESAINCLLSPDAYSRTKVEEGRRIREIDGGWTLINHGKYRALLSAEERREYNRRKQAEYRARDAGNVKKVSAMCMPRYQMSAMSTHTDADADADADADSYSEAPHQPTKKTPTSPRQKPGEGTDDPEFLQFWKAYPKRKGKANAFRAWRKCAGTRPPVSDIIAKIGALRKSDQWRRDGGQFIPLPASWLNSGGWDDEESVDVVPAVDYSIMRYSDSFPSEFAYDAWCIGRMEWMEANGIKLNGKPQQVES